MSRAKPKPDGELAAAVERLRRASRDVRINTLAEFRYCHAGVADLERILAAFPAANATGPVGDAAISVADAALREAKALAAMLADFVEWAEEYRDQCKRSGERPAIDAHRVNRAKALLKKVGR